jgi:hypothetical protein
VSFSKATAAVQDPEWENAEKRLAIWMSSFLDVNRSAAWTDQDRTENSAQRGKRRPFWKLRWAMSAVVALALMGAAFLLKPTRPRQVAKQAQLLAVPTLPQTAQHEQNVIAQAARTDTTASREPTPATVQPQSNRSSTQTATESAPSSGVAERHTKRTPLTHDPQARDEQLVADAHGPLDNLVPSLILTPEASRGASDQEESQLVIGASKAVSVKLISKAPRYAHYRCLLETLKGDEIKMLDNLKGRQYRISTEISVRFPTSTLVPGSMVIVLFGSNDNIRYEEIDRYSFEVR